MITAVSASASNTSVGDAALVEISSSKVSVADAIVGDSSDADAIVGDDVCATSKKKLLTTNQTVVVESNDSTRQPSSLGLHLARQVGDANAAQLLSEDEGDVIEPKKSDALVPTSPFTTVGPAQFINVGGRPCPVLQG